MQNLSEPQLARRLLMTKKTGYTFRHYLSLNYKKYLPGTAVLVLSVFMFLNSRAPNTVPALAVGFVLGGWLRDFQWVMAMKKIWRFTEKVTDWQKVESLANNNV